MTRNSLLLCTAMVFAAANPQATLSESIKDGIRIAQAPVPHADDKDKRPPGQRPAQGAPRPEAPGQHPPPANVPPARQAPATAQPSPPPQHPGAPPPATAQTPPGQAPHVPSPGAQTQPGQPLRPGSPAVQQGAPPAAAQTVPGQPLRPGAPAQAVANAPVDPHSLPQHLDQLRNERHETRVGNQTVIVEQNRTIIREGGHDIIRHDEADRFRFNAREVNVERHGNNTVTVVVRPDGARIFTEVDESGRLMRRVRRDAAGREVILIDNAFEPRGPGFAGFFVQLPAPVIRIPREVYIREAARATADDIYLTLMAPPVDRIERRYGLDEILYSEPLRARMPRVDIDTVNFETGSWEIAPTRRIA